MAVESLSHFLKACRRLLTLEQEGEVAAALAKQWPEPKGLARELIKRGWLTSWQATKIFQGREANLVLGPYVLLDLLGEGGMGQVYKARHTVMDRVVAVKVIRIDRLNDPEAISRFHREIKTVAKLSHVHVVHAYDAAQIGATHFYVMEFVAGTDLARLLKDRGPLPVAEACSYVRQAALGLQHAHEHGLVHRDIKPANLMRANPESAGREPVIKVLDLGLARLRTGPASELSDSELTREGSVMGTPDYLAPEQAANPSAVDIRADIYSLGCTLYHLLSGQVPFPGGTLAQKIQWHQQATPAAIETVRRDLPPGLGAVVRRMMAKEPRDRLQTPAEVADALAPFCPGADHLRTDSSTVTYPDASNRPPTSARSAARLWAVGAGAVLVLAGLAVLALVFWNRDPGRGSDAKIEVVVRLAGVANPGDQKSVVLLLDGQPISFEDLQKEIKLRVGAHELAIQQDGVVLERRDFMVGPNNPQQKIVLPEADRPAGQITILSGHQFEVTSVAFSGDGLRLLSVSPATADGIFLWDVPAGKQVHHYQPGKPTKFLRAFPRSGALSPDGHAALIGTKFDSQGSGYKPWLQVLGLESGTKRWEKLDHTRTVKTVAFSLNGKRAVSADEIGFTKVWDAATGDKIFQLEGSVACFSPTADRVLTAKEMRAHLWLLTEPPQLLQSFEDEGHSERITSLAFAPDGRHVLTGGDATLRWWDVTTGKVVRLFKGHDKEVTSVAIAPDGRRVLSGSKDKTVRLWDVATGNELLRFTEHTDEVNSVSYSPGGRRAASGGKDHTVRLWALPK